jgi:hypothetical protein
MDKIKIFFSAHKILKIFMWAFLILLGLFIVLVIYRVFYSFNLDKTNAQVEKIHNTKLSIDDVMGVNLPLDPGIEADKTVQGIDANQNGIRDDVELAIFNEYPNSAKTRAVLLQYALVLQMEVIQPIENTVTVTEVMTELSRADTCLADTLVPRESPESSRHYSDVEKINTFIKFIEYKQLNTDARKKAEENFYKKVRSYGESTNKICDIDMSLLLD